MVAPLALFLASLGGSAMLDRRDRKQSDKASKEQSANVMRMLDAAMNPDMVRTPNGMDLDVSMLGPMTGVNTRTGAKGTFNPAAMSAPRLNQGQRQQAFLKGLAGLKGPMTGGQASAVEMAAGPLFKERPDRSLAEAAVPLPIATTPFGGVVPHYKANLGGLDRANPNDRREMARRNAQAQVSGLAKRDRMVDTVSKMPESTQASLAAKTMFPDAEKPPGTKSAFDTVLKKSVFATDAEIASNPQRFQPIQSGMKIASDGKGGFEIVTGSAAGAQGGGGLSSSTTGQIEKDILAEDEVIMRMTNLRENYRPEFLTYGGAARDFTSDVLNKMDPARRDEFAAERSGWIAENQQYFNAYRKWATGVSSGPVEMQAIQESIPNVNDSPQDWERKSQNLLRMTRLMTARKRMALRDGVGEEGLKEYAAEVSLEDVRAAVNKRGDELAASGLAPMEVQEILRKEFGI